MTKNEAIKDKIIETALPDVAFDGWSDAVLERAAENAGYRKEMVISVFPRRMKDALIHFSRLADQKTLDDLGAADPAMKIRDRITLAVRRRFEILGQHKEAERLAIAYWLRPMRKFEGAKLVWKTADAIWIWAGDTATDYNHYTKRALLSGVITSTAFYWLNDNSPNHQATWAFLDRRIENVLGIGKIVGRFKSA